MIQSEGCISQRERVEYLITHAEEQRKKDGQAAFLNVCEADYVTHYRWMERELNKHHIFIRIMRA
jgi:hypothetical protein